MENITGLVDDIFSSLKTSPLYSDYTTARQNIISSEDMIEKIRFFKMKHFEYQTKRMKKEEIPFEEEIYISRLYHSLLLNEDARNFLKNEEKLLKAIDLIYKKLEFECNILINDI